MLGLVLAVGCDEDPQWFCQTKEHAEAHDRGRAKCYRMREHCKGSCRVQVTAYCFEVGDRVQVGAVAAPPDRLCYATPQSCAEQTRLRTDSRRPCEAFEE